jgi:hypothetical protein
MNIKDFNTYLQTSNEVKYQDYILKSYNVEFNAQILYDYYIKPILDTPFINEDIPFTLFKFNNNKLDKQKLNQLSYLISYAYIFEKKKKNLLSDLSKKELQDSFFSFYKSKLNEISVLTVNYFENVIKPENPLQHYDISLNKVFTDLDLHKMEDLIRIIKQCFNDITEAEEILCINNDNDASYYAYDNTDYSTSKNNLSLLIYLNKTNILNNNFNNFIQTLKYQYKDLSSYIENIDLFEEGFTSDLQLLELFSNENFFYLDYITLSLHQNKYSLCYLLFVYKVLKVINAYNEYYKEQNFNFRSVYNNTVYDYHKFINNKFKYLSKSLNGYTQFKMDQAILDFTFYDPIGPVYFKHKKNTFDYLFYLNKQNNINILLNEKILVKNSNYKDFLYYFNKYKDLKNFEKIELVKPDILNFDSYAYFNIDLENLY